MHPARWRTSSTPPISRTTTTRSSTHDRKHLNTSPRRYWRSSAWLQHLGGGRWVDGSVQSDSGESAGLLCAEFTDPLLHSNKMTPVSLWTLKQMFLLCGAFRFTWLWFKELLPVQVFVSKDHQTGTWHLTHHPLRVCGIPVIQKHWLGFCLCVFIIK